MIQAMAVLPRLFLANVSSLSTATKKATSVVKQILSSLFDADASEFMTKRVVEKWNMLQTQNNAKAYSNVFKNYVTLLKQNHQIPNEAVLLK